MSLDTLLLVEAARAGDGDAESSLFDAVYGELRNLARRAKRGSGPETLNTTAIVHEAYIKMAGTDGSFEDRAHFLGVAAKAMRHVVVDYVRKKGAQKRGGDAEQVPFRDTLMGDGPDDEVLAIDESLGRLARVNPRGARIVECRFFGGLTIDETAAVLDVSAPTVERGWRAARAWLYRDLQSAA